MFKPDLYNIVDLCKEISGENDLNKLNRIEAAVRERKQAIARQAAMSIKIGDKVTFADNIRPVYLRGLSAVVSGINRESVVVDCPDDPRFGKFSGHKHVRLPVGLIAAKG